MEIICQDQFAFLPMRFILDNILLTQETMALTEASKQDFIFMKLDFLKAYDKVDWEFLFKAMKQLGIPVEFINMTKLLFSNAKASVKINGSPSRSFKISRGVRQGARWHPTSSSFPQKFSMQ